MLLLLSVWAVDKNPNEYLPFTDPIQQAVVKHRDAVRSVWTTATCEPRLRAARAAGLGLALSREPPARLAGVSYAAVPFIGPAPALVCTLQVILPTASGVSNEGRSSPLLVLAPPFLGPGFWLGARWNRLVEAVKTRKKREKTGGKWARYGLKGVKDGS